MANPISEQEIDQATAKLDSAVRSLQNMAPLGHRCAVVAHALQINWDAEDHSTTVERDHKQMRMDPGPSIAASVVAAFAAGFSANSMALRHAKAAGASEDVETHQGVLSEAKYEQYM
ncbi:hypothetical protein FGB62_140g028 [Gracilaria domingensis]|nr:hypothetical protein FGB62_140g028 [Gracilaria domingensis]